MEYDMWKEETLAGCIDQDVHGTTGNLLSDYESGFLIFSLFYFFVGEWCNQNLSDFHFLSFNK